MRKLNVGENIALKDIHNRVSKNKEVIDAVAMLEVGDRLLVERVDWKTKSQPTPSGLLGKTTDVKLTVRTLCDNTGWVISRIA